MTTLTTKVFAKNLLLAAMVPMLFACTKSKFSANRASPVAPYQAAQPNQPFYPNNPGPQYPGPGTHIPVDVPPDVVINDPINDPCLGDCGQPIVEPPPIIIENPELPPITTGPTQPIRPIDNTPVIVGPGPTTPNPVYPVKPYVPAKPVETLPINPVPGTPRPVEPVRPVQPTQPIQVQPIERPVQPTTPTRPVEVRPSQPVTPVRPVETVRRPVETRPVETVRRPVESARPVPKAPLVVKQPVKETKKVVIEEGCQDLPVVALPEYTGPRAMNVWIVMDGSKSNAKERASQLSALIDTYYNNLGRGMPITVSVITGHSPESRHSAISGNLFFQNGKEAKVIKLQAGMNKAAKDAAISALRAKILGMATDNSKGISDGGELLTVNLLAALRDRAKAKAMGAYGKGHLLNIHFVGDENDICTIGKVKDSNKVKTKNGVTTSEELARHKHCGAMDVNNGGHGFSETLANELEAVAQEDKVRIHLTGFVYTNDATVPRDGENEVARGIVDLIEAFKGEAYDLAALTGGQKAYDRGALQLSGHVNREEKLYTYITPKDANGNVLKISDMDTKRTVIYVDKQRVQFKTSAQENHLALMNCPIDGKKVRIKYCGKR